MLPHRPAFTAAGEAASTQTPGDRWAKTIACFADGRPVLAVVPAPCYVDLAKLSIVIGAPDVRLARQDELVWLFPECEPGAMPPFGPLYHQIAVLDSDLAAEPVIVFHAGTHSDAVRMRVSDFVNISEPIIGRIAEPVREEVY